MPAVADPYENFNFRVKWDGQYVAGVSRVSPLVRVTEEVEHREGGSNTTIKSPGRTKFEPITLERGITTDPEFEKWANEVTTGALVFRKDVILDLFNEAGQKVRSYVIHRCWVSEYQALPELDANANAVAIERIKLEHEGWERDTSVVPPPA